MAAGAFHELGQVAKEQGYLEDAKKYYSKALQIYEDKQDWQNASDEYQGLGELAKAQGKLDEAVAYFKKALDIRTVVKDWFKVAGTLIELGETLEAKGEKIEALSIHIQIFIIDSNYNKEEFGFREWVSSDIWNLGRMLKMLGESQFDAVWQEVTGEDCAGEVREVIWAARDSLDS